MDTAKIISLILLAAFLIFNSAFTIFGFQGNSFVNFLLGSAAVGSGVLMLITARRFLHFSGK